MIRFIILNSEKFNLISLWIREALFTEGETQFVFFSILQGFRHLLAKSFREEQGTDSTDESRDSEDDWGEVTEQQNVGSQHCPHTTKHDCKSHPNTCRQRNIFKSISLYKEPCPSVRLCVTRYINQKI